MPSRDLTDGDRTSTKNTDGVSATTRGEEQEVRLGTRLHMLYCMKLWVQRSWNDHEGDGSGDDDDKDGDGGAGEAEFVNTTTKKTIKKR